MLEIDSLAVQFGDGENRGLKNISLSVSVGEFVVLMGRNGSGKSTILDCIAGFRQPAKGRISVAGVNLLGISPHSRSRYVSLVAQNAGVGLPRHMRLGEVLGLCGKSGSLFLPLAWRMQKSALAAKLFEYMPHLSGRLEDQIKTLSGGELQLLSLVCLRLLLDEHRPSAHSLLLDEHVANLDSRLTREVLSASRTLTASYSLATLAVSHSLRWVREFADRLIILRDGEIVDSFTREVLTEMPDDEIEMSMYLPHTRRSQRDDEGALLRRVCKE